MKVLLFPRCVSTLLALPAMALVLASCGGGSGGGGNNTPVAPEPSRPSDSRLVGVVAAAAFVPGSATAPTFKAGYYQGARVCEDSNGNGRCDAAENPVATDAMGRYTLTALPKDGLIADIGSGARNTATGALVGSRLVLRISQAQMEDQAASGIVISALSSEVQREVEANTSSYATEKQNLVQRLGVPAPQVLADFNAAVDAARSALLSEAHELGQRFTYATLKLDRGDLYPDALAVPGGDPEITGLADVTPLTATTKDSRKAITFLQSQQAAFQLEGIPRYDHIFIIMLENKAQLAMVNSPSAPHINAFLTAGNQATNYFSTGNPSQPNYIALGSGDDFGIADNAPWNCNAVGPNALQDLVPELIPAGATQSPFPKSCSIPGVSHNIVGKPNLFTALSSKGLTWRVYSQSMNPGQDPRMNSVGDAAVVAPDNFYAAGTLPSVRGDLGNTSLMLPMPDNMYAIKHNPSLVHQSVRSSPEFRFSNRTLGAGQWDVSMKKSTAYAMPANYDVDQFSTDLATGQFGHLNFVVPDQCDSMHGHAVPGTVVATGKVGTASDCNYTANNVAAAIGGPIITRGDNFVGKIVAKIQASALWKNPQRKVAIVIVFDEGSATGGFNSCCGWNPGGSPAARPLIENADGSFSADTTQELYARGNRGHGQTIFGVMNNQPSAPKGIKDNDAYSHFSFVRTLQNMFQLADPARPGSYMNRTKYTEKFIAKNLSRLPEYASSADTHFDAVRPMNHAFIAPPTYVQKQSSDAAFEAQKGPDASQANIWATR